MRRGHPKASTAQEFFRYEACSQPSAPDEDEHALDPELALDMELALDTELALDMELALDADPDDPPLAPLARATLSVVKAGAA